MSASLAPVENKSFFAYAFEGLHELKSDTSGFYQALTLAYYGAASCELMAKGTGSIIKHQVECGLSVIDFYGETISCLTYWLGGKFLEDANAGGIFSLLGNICMSLATIGGGVLYLAELGFYKLADVMLKIGSWIFGLGSALLVFVRVFSTAGFALFCANAIKNAVVAKTDAEKTHAILETTAMAFSAGLQVLFIAAAPMWTIIIFGLIASGLGIASFLHGHFAKVEL